jgi:hypothetical protein
MKRKSLEENPFLVLGIPTTATRMEVERAGQKLLAQLAVQSASAKTYASPFGPRERDETKVRTALAALRDPEQRALHEIWATLVTGNEPARPFVWTGALASVGWRAPWE